MSVTIRCINEIILGGIVVVSVSTMTTIIARVTVSATVMTVTVTAMATP